MGGENWRTFFLGVENRRDLVKRNEKSEGFGKKVRKIGENGYKVWKIVRILLLRVENQRLKVLEVENQRDYKIGLEDF